MNWREFISGLYDTRPSEPGLANRPAFYPPASAEVIAELEARLHTKLPVPLHSLLLQTNGVMDTLSIDGGEWFHNCWLVWPAEEIVTENVRHRAERMRDDHRRSAQEPLFFANAGGDGILFGHPVSDDRAPGEQVVVWHPIEDKLTDVAATLKDFVDGWLSGRISV